MYVILIHDEFKLISALGEELLSCKNGLTIQPPPVSDDDFEIVVEVRGVLRVVNAKGQPVSVGEKHPTGGLELLNPFSNGRLPAQHENSKWGYIGTDGEWVINPVYERVCPFVHGLALVQDGEAIKAIDPAGHTVWKQPYAFLELCTGCDSEWNPMFFAAFVRARKHYRPCLIRSLNEIVPLKGAEAIAHSGSNCLILRTMKRGIMAFQLRNDRGDVVLDGKRYISTPSDGLLCCREPGSDSFAMYTETGVPVETPSLKHVVSFSNRWAVHETDQGVAIVDLDFRAVVEADHGRLGRHPDGVVWHNRSWMEKSTEALCINDHRRVVWASSPEVRDRAASLVRGIVG